MSFSFLEALASKLDLGFWMFWLSLLPFDPYCILFVHTLRTFEWERHLGLTENQTGPSRNEFEIVE